MHVYKMCMYIYIYIYIYMYTGVCVYIYIYAPVEVPYERQGGACENSCGLASRRRRLEPAAVFASSPLSLVGDGPQEGRIQKYLVTTLISICRLYMCMYIYIYIYIYIS